MEPTLTPQPDEGFAAFHMDCDHNEAVTGRVPQPAIMRITYDEFGDPSIIATCRDCGERSGEPLPEGAV